MKSNLYASTFQCLRRSYQTPCLLYRTRKTSNRGYSHKVLPRLRPITQYITLHSSAVSSLPRSYTQSSHFATMAIETAPLPLPASADPTKFTEFGREVLNVNPGNLSPEEFAEVEKLLYKVRGDLLVRRSTSADRQLLLALSTSVPQC